MTLRFACALAAAVGLAAPALATITPAGSGSKGYFGSQSSAYQDADPFTTFTGPGAPYTPGPNPYPIGSTLPNLPGQYGPPGPRQYPSSTPNTFQVPGGYTYQFTDNFGGSTQVTAATTVIDHGFLPAGTNSGDAWIDFPVWRFAQGPAAPGYAYEQINFWSDYLVSTPLNASPAGITLFISGSTSALGTPFVQFDAAVTYTWYDTNSAGVVASTGTVLGTINYSWIAPGGSSFLNQPITPTGTLSATPAGSNAGVLELTGYAWVAGDPFHVEIFDVPVLPEPATLASLLAASVPLLLRRRSRTR